MTDKRKLLIITPIFPYPPQSGGQVRIFNILKHVSRYFDVSLLSFSEKGQASYLREVKPFCRRVETVAVENGDRFSKMLSLAKPSQIVRNVKRITRWATGDPLRVCRFYHPEMERKLEMMVSEEGYDFVHAIYCQMAPYLAAAKALDGNILAFMEDIDLSFVAAYREFQTRRGVGKALACMEYKRVKDYALRVWPSFDRIIVTSGVDREKVFGLSSGIGVSVVPNGVDTDHFQPMEVSGRSRKLAFLGGSLHYPNVDAVRYFCEHILARLHRDIPQISLKIVGDFAGSCIDPAYASSVEFTGFVDDTRPHMADCALLIVPLRIGGGTRLKILEAMAMGVPVVSTSIGCEGIEVERDRNILIADDPLEFADSIVAVLENETLHRSLSLNGRRLVEEKYDWRRIVAQMAQDYDEYATGAGAPSQMALNMAQGS